MLKKKMSPIVRLILKLTIGLLITIGTSRIATSDPTIDKSLKEFINQAGDVLIDALTQSPDTISINQTVKADTDTSFVTIQ